MFTGTKFRNQLDVFEKEVLELIKSAAAPVIHSFKSSVEAEKRKSTKYQTSGNIDTDRLSQFRTAESIFTKKLIQSGQTNHGIFILQDLSGSLNNICSQSWLNMAIIAYTGKELDIPVKIVGFTEGASIQEDHIQGDLRLVDLYDSTKEGDFDSNILKSFALFNSWWALFFSGFKDIHHFTRIPDTFNAMMFYRNKFIKGNECTVFDDSPLKTPTHKSMVYSAQSFSTFLRKTKVDIINYIIMTDGISNGTCFANSRSRIVEFKVDGLKLSLHNNTKDFQICRFYYYPDEIKKAQKEFENLEGIWNWLREIAKINGCSKLNSVWINILDQTEWSSARLAQHSIDIQLRDKFDYDLSELRSITIDYDLEKEKNSKLLSKNSYIRFNNVYNGLLDSMIYISLGPEKNKLDMSSRTKRKIIREKGSGSFPGKFNQTSGNPLSTKGKRVPKGIIRESLSDKKTLSKRPIFKEIGIMLAVRL